MEGPYYSKQNVNFMLYEVLDVLSLTKHPYFAVHNSGRCNIILDTAEEIAEKYGQPFLKESVRQQPELINGEVKVHKAVEGYYKAFLQKLIDGSKF